ncbi:unnamed protein product [Effrenium voratum]|nr:unnamed protein product [Effrenium voratum]
MSQAEFAAWWEEQRELRENCVPFADALRREVARRLQLRNFRKLALLCGEQLLGPDSPWNSVESLLAVVKPYVDVGDGVADFLKAASAGDAATVMRFLDKPLDPSTCDGRKRSALHESAQGGHVDIARSLLEANVDMDAFDTFGRSPLHWAASKGHLHVVTSLLEAGANKDTKDPNRKTPMNLASAAGHYDVVHVLRPTPH